MKSQEIAKFSESSHSHRILKTRFRYMLKMTKKRKLIKGIKAEKHERKPKTKINSRILMPYDVVEKGNGIEIARWLTV